MTLLFLLPGSISSSFVQSRFDRLTIRQILSALILLVWRAIMRRIIENPPNFNKSEPLDRNSYLPLLVLVGGSNFLLQ